MATPPVSTQDSPSNSARVAPDASPFSHGRPMDIPSNHRCCQRPVNTAPYRRNRALRVSSCRGC
jgi:hypothetical protein